MQCKTKTIRSPKQSNAANNIFSALEVLRCRLVLIGHNFQHHPDGVGCAGRKLWLNRKLHSTVIKPKLEFSGNLTQIWIPGWSNLNVDFRMIQPNFSYQVIQHLTSIPRWPNLNLHSQVIVGSRIDITQTGWARIKQCWPWLTFRCVTNGTKVLC